MNIAKMLSMQAEERGREVALVERDRRVTFAELEAGARAAGGMLLADGVRAGDYVLILAPMSVEFYVALLAVFRIGAVAMVVDPSGGMQHLKRCCEMARPAAMIGVKKAYWLRWKVGALRRIRLKYSIAGKAIFTRAWEKYLTMGADSHLHGGGFDTPALLTFTSGSTGRPKAAVRSHGLLLAQRTALKEALRLEPGQVDLTTLPIFVLVNLACGVRSVIADADLRRPAKIEAGAVLKQIERERPVSTVASPAFLARLAEGGEKLESFERIFTGGAPVFPSLMRKLREVAPSTEIVAVYGSTEAEPIAHVGMAEISQADFAGMKEGKGLLAGKPVPQVELRILRQQWGRPVAAYTEGAFTKDCVGVNVAGEIVVSGDHVLKGYLNGAGDEETKFRVGNRVWHRTGDAGYLDEKGRVWLLGRCEARVEDDRGEIYPFAVECAAMEMGAQRAALIGVGGKRVLVVEGQETGLKSQLEWAKLDEVRRVKKIPVDKRHNAKVDYVELRRMMGD